MLFSDCDISCEFTEDSLSHGEVFIKTLVIVSWVVISSTVNNSIIVGEVIGALS
tara:strand:- start:39 stop:200 length:162 start_codon:yes stop_codon:yes gene_type:complete